MNFPKLFVLSGLALLLLGTPIVYVVSQGMVSFGVIFFALVIGGLSIGLVSRYDIKSPYSGFWCFGLSLIYLPLATVLNAFGLTFILFITALFFVGWIYVVRK